MASFASSPQSKMSVRLDLQCELKYIRGTPPPKIRVSMNIAKRTRTHEPNKLCKFENDKFNIQYGAENMEKLQTEWRKTNTTIHGLIKGDTVQTDNVIEEMKKSFIKMFDFWRDKMQMLHDELHHGGGKKISGMTTGIIGEYSNIDFLALMVMMCTKSFDEQAINVFGKKYDAKVYNLRNSYAESIEDHLDDIKQMTHADTGNRVILMYGYVKDHDDKNLVPVGFAWLKFYKTAAMQRTMTVFSQDPHVRCDAVMNLEFRENTLGQIILLCSYAKRNGVCITGVSAEWLIDYAVLLARQERCSTVIIGPANASLGELYRKWMWKDSRWLDLITLAYIQFTVITPLANETTYILGKDNGFMWILTNEYSLLMHGVPAKPRLACNYCVRRFREMDY